MLEEIDCSLKLYSNIIDFESNRLLLTGSNQSLLLSLGFRLAYEYAEKELECLFICSKDFIESELPLFVKIEGKDSNNNNNNSQWNPRSLNKILMKYVSTKQDVKILFASLHAFKPRPKVIIIHDMFRTLFASRELVRNDVGSCEQLSHVMNLLDDSILCLEQMHEMDSNVAATANIRCVITDSSSNSTYHHFLKHFITLPVLSIKDNNVRDISGSATTTNVGLFWEFDDTNTSESKPLLFRNILHQPNLIALSNPSV